MNRSFFQSSPFRPSYGLQPMLQPARYQVQMGQDIISDIFGGDISALSKDFDSFLLKLPVDVAGNFSKRRDECIAKPTLSQYKCLYDLFQDMKKAYKGDGTPVTPPVNTPPPAPKSELPILPIAIGAVAAAGLLYFAFGRG